MINELKRNVLVKVLIKQPFSNSSTGITQIIDTVALHGGFLDQLHYLTQQKRTRMKWALFLSGKTMYSFRQRIIRLEHKNV